MSEGPFWIAVETKVLMSDDGWTETCGGSDHWGSWSYIRCNSCDETGLVREFNAERARKADKEEDKKMAAMAHYMADPEGNADYQ